MVDEQQSWGELPMQETSSHEILRMLEGFGLTGYWTWDFASDQHHWSDGLYQLCGLPVGSVAADYALLFRMIHPDDRSSSLEPDIIRHAGILTTETFRILRPDSTIRTVMSRGEINVSADGRPLSAQGVLVDVSDRDVMARALSAQGRQRRAVFERLGAFTSTTTVYPFADFSREWVDLVGLPKEELVAEPARPVIPEERRHWRDHGRELYLAKQLVHIEPHLVLATGAVVLYRIVMMPIFDRSGEVECWTNYVGPVHLPVKAAGRLRHGLEQRIEGVHLRAARALLDWSMADLAKASGLSFAVIRRLETSEDGSPCPTRHRAVEALRQAGVVFSLGSGSTIAVGRIR